MNGQRPCAKSHSTGIPGQLPEPGSLERSASVSPLSGPALGIIHICGHGDSEEA